MISLSAKTHPIGKSEGISDIDSPVTTTVLLVVSLIDPTAIESMFGYSNGLL